MSTTSTAVKGSSSKKKITEESKVAVVFTTKNADIRVPEVKMTVPLKCTRYGLSEIINLLLGKDHPKPFDFLIDSEFVRTSIDKHLYKHNINREEEVINIEYMEAILPPEKEMECEHDDWVSSVAGSFSGYVLTGSYDSKARIWDQKTGACIATAEGHKGSIKAVAWLNKAPKREGGKMKFVTASMDHTIISWRAKKEEEAATIHHIYKGHTATVNSVHVNIAGDKICTGSYDTTIRIWDAKATPENSTSASANSASDGQQAKKRRLDTAPQIMQNTSLVGHTASVTCVSWPTEHQLISASADHTIRLWDVASEANNDTFTAPTVVNTVAYSTVHGLIVSGHSDKTIRIWDPRAESGRMAQQTLYSHQGWTSSVAWHPYSQYPRFASSSHDKTIKVWDLRSPLPLFTLSHHTDKVLAVDWSGLLQFDEENNTKDVNESQFDLVSGGADNKMRVFACNLTN